MAKPHNFTKYLTELTVATATARDLGYVHTARALNLMVEAEKSHLRRSLHVLKDSSPPLAQTSEAV